MSLEEQNHAELSELPPLQQTSVIGRDMEPQAIPQSTLDESNASRDLGLVSELFHRIIPETQHLLTITPEMDARVAIALLRQHGYSQAPVVAGGEVLGVFSFRSFALKAAGSSLQEMKQHKYAPGDLAVEECLERFEFVRVTEEMQRVFDTLDRDSGVLIGSPEKLQCILTPMDVLRYLYKVAAPFVMISEIELTLRALIRLAVNEEELKECAIRSLKDLYSELERVPSTLEGMTFDNYKSIISHGENWSKFEPLLGGNRARTAAKLKQLCDLRNDVFHFKREITLQDHKTLSDHRAWLLLKAKQADTRRNTGGSS